MLADFFVCVVEKEADSINDYSFVRTKSQNFFGAMPQWAKPGHFSRTIAKRPHTTT
ncbi:hypothetical protein MtrunA17_Chr7g0216421 [Medicago truncatula]|uniref:Uncharacterized protein n=1 Tax=Medicago truncatula TaxID=3880 RepID=A2Q2R9_MEDTR|nr:hypothetical protein MtrDRAFT_AC151524g37v2 [Medicago truncatula]RHN44163.1 hypothetical protein MtrunA17_Chr7g0216421 [Medicago truncatula]